MQSKPIDPKGSVPTRPTRPKTAEDDGDSSGVSAGVVGKATESQPIPRRGWRDASAEDGADG